MAVGAVLATHVRTWGSAFGEMAGANTDWRRSDMCVLQAIVAVLLPPLAVLWKRGLGSSFLLSIILTILGYVPGLVYALYVVITGRD